MISALKRLLNPKSIAIIGGKEGEQVIEQSIQLGFSGQLWAVNPHRDTLAAVKCYKHIAELPDIPDAAFIAIPPKAAVDAIKTLKDIGAGGAVCYTSGFAEHSEQGKTLQKELITASTQFAVIGPNCYGFLNYLDGVALWPDLHGCKRVDDGAAIIMQSGNLALSLSFNDRSLPISHLITIGNRAVIDVHHLINTLLEDERVTAIGLYIEAIIDINAFITASHAALKKGIPIVVVKSGKSESGAQITISHTSSFAGEHRLYSALFEQLGIICADSFTEFVETLKLFALNRSFRSGRFISLSCSGGEAALIADATANTHISMPLPSKKAQDKFSKVLGEKVHITNPLDYHTYIWGDFDKQKECFATAIDDYDSVALIIDYPNIENPAVVSFQTTLKALIAAKEAKNTTVVVISTLPESLPKTVRDWLITARITPLQGLSDAVKAMANVAYLMIKKDQITARPPTIKQYELDDSKYIQLSELDSKKWLENAGLTTPNACICTQKNGTQMAEKIGYPVVLKIHSDKIAHKSDSGGVRLNINHPEQLMKAMKEMASLGDTFLLEKMITNAVAEMIIGIKHDPLFGQVLVIGIGGVFVELLKDTRTLLLPTDAKRVKTAIESLQCYPILSGYRGSVKADIDALIATIIQLTEYVASHPVLELDINPLLVLTQGNGVIAVDALVNTPLEPT